MSNDPEHPINRVSPTEMFLIGLGIGALAATGAIILLTSIFQ